MVSNSLVFIINIPNIHAEYSSQAFIIQKLHMFRLVFSIASSCRSPPSFLPFVLFRLPPLPLLPLPYSLPLALPITLTLTLTLALTLTPSPLPLHLPLPLPLPSGMVRCYC